jgi:hypothetical protein
MKKYLILFSWLSMSALAPMSAHAESLPPEEARECKTQPLTFACLDRYAQRNQDNIAKLLGDITAGRPAVLPPPALPLLEGLPPIDLGRLGLK